MTAATPPVRAVLLDPNDGSRRRIRDWIEREPGVELIGEVPRLDLAVGFFRRRRPQVVFVGPHAKGTRVFEVLFSLVSSVRPLAVFVDGDPSDAARAFELDAVDYIVGPVTNDRLSLALVKVRRRLSESHVPTPIPLAGNRLAIRVSGRILLLPIESIRSLHARNVQTEIHADEAIHLVHQPLRELESRLPADRFVRVHRSTLVNIARVRQLRPKAHGDGTAVMDDGREIEFSRSHRQSLRNALFVRQSPTELGRASAA